MKKLDITIPEHTKKYPIYIDENILNQVSELAKVTQYSQIVIITDEYLEKHWLKKLTSSFSIKPHTIVLKPGEQAKTITSVEYIWQQLLQFGCDRKSLVINFGGGVIGDMGGFAASTYMRGIDFVQIPTTLLAAVDASIGGKTGIDFMEIKNLIGTFQQPVGIIIDTAVLKTLPEREFLSGFGEILKQGLIQDKEYFYVVTAKAPKEYSAEELTPIIERSCQLKSSLVMQDEKEEGERKILNFGHTIGHAIESLSWKTEMPLKHGEAVHIGMIAETKLSQTCGLLSDQEATEILQALHKTGLPTSIKKINVKEIVNLIVKDKKNAAGQIKWVLLKHLGAAVYDQEITDETIVQKAIEFITSK